jgi:metal-responsive CopG/Arc/MetJ family transcriptional regulator
MRITVTIDKKALDELIAESRQGSMSAALRDAVVFYLKRKKIERIKQNKGNMKFDRTAEEIRHSV